MAWKDTAKKYIRKGAKKAYKRAGNRYFGGKKATVKNAKLGTMAKDIMALKRMVNTERKQILREERTPINMALTVNPNKTTTSIVGEATYAGRAGVLRSGAYVKTDLIGSVNRGTGDDEMLGDQFKLISYHMNYRIKAVESNSTTTSWGKAQTKVRLFLVMMPRGEQCLSGGVDVGANLDENLLLKFFNRSTFDDTWDGVNRNVSHMKDFKVIQSKTCTFYHDETNDSSLSSARFDGISEGKFGGKLFDTYLRYDGNDLMKNQLALICIPDSGDLEGTATASNRYTLEYSFSGWFVDN